MKRGIWFTVAMAAVLLLEAAFAVYMLSSSALISEGSRDSRRKFSISDFDNNVRNVSSSILSNIYEIPKAYVLPLVDEPMPEPNTDGYTVVTDSDIATWNNTDVLRYEDETTCVTVWKEYYESRLCHAVVNFAEIEIAHPTQIRRHFAGWDYGYNHGTCTALSDEVNAVVAISGDYYNYRRTGIVINNGTLYRSAPVGYMADTLFVNSDGDFIIESCEQGFDTETYLSENNIMFSLIFGPTLVNDGRAITKKEVAEYRGDGGAAYLNPRAAVGQIDSLHYLFCTVDGRTAESNGITADELAALMSKKGCKVAYNLDGGGSATMVFNNTLFNKPSSGGERRIADIIYIATAVPD